MRFRDFDAFLAESQGEPLTFKLHGREYQLPPAAPASMVLKSIRMLKEYGAATEVPPSDLMEMALSLFGQDSLDRMLADQVTIVEMSAVIDWALTEYQGGADPEAKAPDADADGASTLSSAGGL